MRTMFSLVVALAALAACKGDQSPRATTVAGTWSGSTSAGTLQLVVTHDGTLVGGTGSYQIGATASQAFSLNRVDNTPSGTLVGTALMVSVRNTAGSGCTGNLQGTFGQAESDADSFVAHFTCGTWAFDGTVTR